MSDGNELRKGEFLHPEIDNSVDQQTKQVGPSSIGIRDEQSIRDDISTHGNGDDRDDDVGKPQDTIDDTNQMTNDYPDTNGAKEKIRELQNKCEEATAVTDKPLIHHEEYQETYKLLGNSEKLQDNSIENEQRELYINDIMTSEQEDNGNSQEQEEAIKRIDQQTDHHREGYKTEQMTNHHPKSEEVTDPVVEQSLNEVDLENKIYHTFQSEDNITGIPLEDTADEKILLSDSKADTTTGEQLHNSGTVVCGQQDENNRGKYYWQQKHMCK